MSCPAPRSAVNPRLLRYQTGPQWFAAAHLGGKGTNPMMHNQRRHGAPAWTPGTWQRLCQGATPPSCPLKRLPPGCVPNSWPTAAPVGTDAPKRSQETTVPEMHLTHGTSRRQHCALRPLRTEHEPCVVPVGMFKSHSADLDRLCSSQAEELSRNCVQFAPNSPRVSDDKSCG